MKNTPAKAKATKKKKPASKKRKAAESPVTVVTLADELANFSLIHPFSFKESDWEYKEPAFDIAERRARQAENSAHWKEKHGNVSGANAERKLAAQWRNLPKSDIPDRICRRASKVARFNIDQLLVLAQQSACNTSFLGLLHILEQVTEGFHALAANGHKLAALHLVSYLAKETDSFNRLANAKPKLFPFLNEAAAIPGMISPRKEKTASNARLCERLHVGEKCGLAVIPTGKGGRTWSVQTPANLLALRLKGHIEAIRDQFSIIKPIEEQAGRELPKWFKEAEKLAPFSASACVKWAEVAWQLLASESPDGCAENHPVFKDTQTWGYVVKGKSKVKLERERTAKKYRTLLGWKKKADREAPSISKHDICEALRGGFVAIARGITERTKQRRGKTKPRKHA